MRRNLVHISYLWNLSVPSVQYHHVASSESNISGSQFFVVENPCTLCSIRNVSHWELEFHETELRNHSIRIEFRFIQLIPYKINPTMLPQIKQFQ